MASRPIPKKFKSGKTTTATTSFGPDDDVRGPNYEPKSVDELRKKKWKGYDEEAEGFLRNLPKVELHVHLDGSLDPELLLSHLEENNGYECLPANTVLPWDGSKFPVKQLVEDCKGELTPFISLCTCRGKRSLKEMIKCFEIFLPIVRGNLTLIEKLAYDLVKRQAEQNVMYTEVRYSPHWLADGGSSSKKEGEEAVNADPVIDAVTRGLRAGEKKYGVKVNQIICCIAWRPDWAEDVVRIANERRNDFPCAVVGIDIAAGEEHFDKKEHPDLYNPHYEAFQKARELKLNVTMHAGEVEGAENVEHAVKAYNAKRIGHGYRVIDNTNLVEELVKDKVHFEICPTSSVETGAWEYEERVWTKHPMLAMMDKGLKVGLNSDDPAVFHTSMTWQFRLAVGKMKLSKEIVSQTVHDSIDATFLPEEEKESLRRILDDYVSKGIVKPPYKSDSFSERVDSVKNVF